MKYYLKINGGSLQETRDLGMSFTGLELQNMQADSAALRWTRRRVSDACPLAHNDTVEIFADERRIFRGRARLGTVTSEGMGIQIVGPWSHLEELTYQMSLLGGSYGTPAGKLLGQTFSVSLPAGSQVHDGRNWVTLPSDHTISFTVATRGSYAGYPATTGLLDVNLAWSARCWLFRPGGTAGQVYTTILDEWDRIMTYMGTIHDPDVYDVGTVQLGGAVAPRTRTLTESPVSDALRQCLAMKPDAAVWWDYGGSGVPSIHVRVASLETARELVIGQQVLSEYTLKVADDLVPTGVIIRWEAEITDLGSYGLNTSQTGLGQPYLADFYPGQAALSGCTLTNGSTSISTTSTAGLAVGMMVAHAALAVGVTVSTIPSGTTFTVSSAPSGIGGSGILTAQRIIARAATGAACHQPGILLHTVTDETPYVAGIAKEIYDSLAVRRAQGTLTVIDRDFTLGLRPGMVISLSGDPHLAGVQLWVQRVSWSPATGLAQVTVGYPTHLQLRDRIDLKGWLRASFTGPYGEYSSWIVPAP